MADDVETPKLRIDEDWKTQVQAEKDALARARQSDAGSTTVPSGATEPAARPRPASAVTMPPASLLMLVSMLATQATIALGGMPDPINAKVEVDLDQARQLIDLLQVLEDKTQGNRTPQESAVFTRLLDELRLGYVAVKQDHTLREGATTGAPK